MLSTIAIARGNAALGAPASAYGTAADCLRSFDRLAATARARQDAVVAAATAPAVHYPQPEFGGPPHSLGAAAGALAAFVASESGRKALGDILTAVAPFFKEWSAARGPEQLSLPLELAKTRA